MNACKILTMAPSTKFNESQVIKNFDDWRQESSFFRFLG